MLPGRPCRLLTTYQYTRAPYRLSNCYDMPRARVSGRQSWAAHKAVAALMCAAAPLHRRGTAGSSVAIKGWAAQRRACPAHEQTFRPARVPKQAPPEWNAETGQHAGSLDCSWGPGSWGVEPWARPQHLPRVAHGLEEQEDEDEQVDDDHAVDDAPHSRVRPRHARRGPLQECIPCTPTERVILEREPGSTRAANRLQATGRHVFTAL